MYRFVLVFWYLLSFTTLSSSRALPAPETNLNPEVSLLHVPGVEQQSQVRELSLSRPAWYDLGSLNARPSIRRRWMSGILENGWQVTHEQLSTFLPSQAVSSVLESFYRSVMIDAMTTWYNTPEGRHYIVRQGPVELEFYSPTETITWLWIAHFASSLLDMTRRGYARRYNAIFLNVLAGVQISVELRINIAPAAPAA